MTLSEARALVAAPAGYLDTASVGVPAAPTIAALQEDLAAWSQGTRRAPDYDLVVARARALWSQLVGVPASWTAIAPAFSPIAALVAAALPEGAEVLVARGDFTSVSFPFAARPRLKLVESELGTLPEAIGPRTALVAVSAVQSADGRVARLDEIAAAAAQHGALTFVDATQACGWLPLDGTRFDVLACAAYKWLACPRGTAFASIGPALLDRIPPLMANWFAGEERWDSIYGLPLRLAADARRFDVSPAWAAWVGAVPALKLLLDVGVDAIHAHDVALANRVLEAIELPASNSAIVSLAAAEPPAGLRASMRAGRLRAGFHFYNDEDDADALVAALRPARPSAPAAR